jgi:6-pyruvoyltetrahydropterin/6-carboxytetrahydropterin synthase
MLIIKEFEFDAAHYLPSYHGKCERLHGHTYKLVVKVQGVPDAEGMVIDFLLLKRTVQEHALDKLDHVCLNDILPQPSAENLAIFVWKALVDVLRTPRYQLFAVEIWETKTSGCVYQGDLC